MKKSKRMTRNSYKRKVIVLGIMIFMSIALVSTGFAAWVISRNTVNEDTKGNISIGVVQDNEIKFDIKEFYTEEETQTQDFRFEPEKDDKDGIVRTQVNENGESINYELMTLTIKGTITGVSYLTTNSVSGKRIFKLKLDLLSNASGVLNAIKAGYLTAKVSLFEGEITNNEINKKSSQPIVDTKSLDGKTFVDLSLNTTANDYVFVIEIAFEWGEMFNGENPSRYFDDETTMKKYFTKYFCDTTLGTTFEDWKEIAGNEEKTEDDYLEAAEAIDSNGPVTVDPSGNYKLSEAYKSYLDYVVYEINMFTYTILNLENLEQKVLFEDFVKEPSKYNTNSMGYTVIFLGEPA